MDDLRINTHEPHENFIHDILRNNEDIDNPLEKKMQKHDKHIHIYMKKILHLSKVCCREGLVDACFWAQYAVHYRHWTFSRAFVNHLQKTSKPWDASTTSSKISSQNKDLWHCPPSIMRCSTWFYMPNNLNFMHDANCRLRYTRRTCICLGFGFRLSALIFEF